MPDLIIKDLKQLVYPWQKVIIYDLDNDYEWYGYIDDFWKDNAKIVKLSGQVDCQIMITIEENKNEIH